MRFGFCTGFAASMTGQISYPLLEAVAQGGYDYAEFPLMQLAALPQGEFDALARALPDLGLGADSACNMFPGSVRLIGPEADRAQISDYLDVAFSRVEALGIRKLVLGSSAARDLPAGMSVEAGYRALEELLLLEVIPRLERTRCLLAMEPIARPAANFINTLADGMVVVNHIRHPNVWLLADTMHLLMENEGPRELGRVLSSLVHVHVSELDRLLPVEVFSPGLEALLNTLRHGGYASTVSFETGAWTAEAVRAALERLRGALGV